jgi:hypothetical protein
MHSADQHDLHCGFGHTLGYSGVAVDLIAQAHRA